MNLNFALYLENNEYVNTTALTVSTFMDRVIADGGTFEGADDLYNELELLGGTYGNANIFKRVNLFQDETVSITQVIQDVKDISKIFTEFTKTFSIPADATNNKIFKHYYNYDIDNGFDGRLKINAYIEINSIRFNSGKVKLEGVDLKDGKPYAYRITYFGDTVNLKDVIGEDKLNALDLSAYNLNYNSDTVLEKLQATVSTSDVIAPFISHTRRYYYDSVNEGANDSFANNLYYTSGGGGGQIHGLLWSSLKYGLRISKIVEAIESKYGLTFSDDFFNSSNLDYHNLYMWLHRQKGNVQGAVAGVNPPEIVSSWTLSDGAFGSITNSTTLEIYETVISGRGYENMDINTSTASAEEYKLIVFLNGVSIFESATVTGSQYFPLPQASIGSYTVYIQAQNIISFSNIYYQLHYEGEDQQNQPVPEIDVFTTTAFNTNNTFIFDVAQQIPEIKTLDFLTGIFKMFNLTAYVENGIIVVKTLNDYYSTGEVYDITQYNQMDSKSIDVALPYKQITFGYEDTGTLLALKHNQQFNYQWGKEFYQQDSAISGEVYNINLPFSHMKYERLRDSDTDAQTAIQWGYSAADNYNSTTGDYDAYIGKPLLFYPILTSGQTISFKPTDSTRISISSFIVPSNSLVLDPNTSKVNINFKAEINEWTGGSGFTDTLFQKYYSAYIQQIFNPKNRLTKIKAILPLSILTNFKLNDRFQIVDKLFRINKITTNLINGESDIELLNEL